MMTRDDIRAGEDAERRGDLAEAARAYERAAEQQVPAVRADALFHLGRIAWRTGRYEDAVRRYEQARALAQDAGDEETRARSENGIGAVHYARGAYAQARACYASSLELTKDDSLRGKILLNLGVIANIEGDFEDARQKYRRSLETFDRAGDESGRALVLHNLGMLHADQERWDEADEAYSRCLEICERQGNRPMVANVLLNRAELLCARGDLDAAVAHADRALAIHTEVGDAVGRGEALRWRGDAYRRLGRREQAERSLREAVRIAQQHGVTLLEAEASRELASVREADGDAAGAVKWLERARKGFVTLGAQRDLAAADAEMARLGAG